MVKSITDIIDHSELMQLFNQADKNTNLTTTFVDSEFSQSLKGLIRDEAVHTDEQIHHLINHVVILLRRLDDASQIRLKNAIENPNQRHLNLRNLCLGDKETEIIADLLYFTSVTSLDVSSNNIGENGAAKLAENQSLTSLDVSWNNIGEDGTANLAENKSLTSLDVSGNNIGDNGAANLGKNKSLSSLDVRGNNIGDNGAAKLAENKNLTSLKVSDNNMAATSIKKIQEMLKSNRDNITNFLNEASALGQGIPLNESHQQRKLPAEVNCIIASELAAAHGIFKTPRLNKRVLDNLFPSFKYSDEEKVTYNDPDFIGGM